MPETIEDIMDDVRIRLLNIPPGDQYAQVIAALQALGFGSVEMQATLDGLAELQTFVFDTDPNLAPLFQYMHGTLISGSLLQQRCVPPPVVPPPVP